MDEDTEDLEKISGLAILLILILMIHSAVTNHPQTEVTEP